MAQDKKIVLDNVEVSWFKVQEPSLKYKSENEYEYSVAVKANDQIRNLLTDYKINKTLKSKDSTFEGEEFITLSLDTQTQSGWKRYGEIYDMTGEPMQDLVGNGSIVRLFVAIGNSSYGNLIKLGHLDNMDQDRKEMFFHFGQVRKLVQYEASNAIIKEATASHKSDAVDEEVTYAIED